MHEAIGYCCFCHNSKSYMYFSTARKMAYVTDVKVISGSHEQISPSYDYTKIDVDLNAGAWGKYIYLCYKSGERDDAITGLQVSVCLVESTACTYRVEWTLHTELVALLAHPPSSLYVVE